MRANWKQAKIEDICSHKKGAIAIGPFGSRLKSDNYVDSGVPVIRGTNITGGPKFGGDFVYITEEKASELGSANVYQNDLVFPHRGAIGEVGIVLDDAHYVLSSSLMKLSCDFSKANPKFLYYFFKSRLGKHELLKNASQVGTPGIGQPLTSLKSIELLFPPIKTQNKIASILFGFDQKIELNNQINQTLEAMAQALFKSWFVDFEPVKAKIEARATGADAEGVTLAAMEAISGQNAEALAKLAQTDPARYAELKATAELFPDALVESELGEIPAGWEYVSLEQLIKVKHGFAFKGKQFTDQQTAFYVMTPGNFKIGGGFKAGKPKFFIDTPPDDYVLKQGDLVITMTDLSKQGDTLGYPAIIPFHPSHKFLHNQRLGKVEFLTTSADIYFLYCFLCSTQYRNEIVSGATGSTVKHTSPSKIQATKLPFNEKLSNRFNHLVKPFFQQIQKLEEEIYSLESVRDTLLPKLLSGEVSVEALGETQ